MINKIEIQKLIARKLTRLKDLFVINNINRHENILVSLNIIGLTD